MVAAGSAGCINPVDTGWYVAGWLSRGTGTVNDGTARGILLLLLLLLPLTTPRTGGSTDVETGGIPDMKGTE